MRPGEGGGGTGPPCPRSHAHTTHARTHARTHSPEQLAALRCYNPYSPETPTPLAVCGGWLLLIDAPTQLEYYVNGETGESSWSAPPDWSPTEATVPPLTTFGEWSVMRDSASLQLYFMSTVTGEATWTVPPSIEADVYGRATAQASGPARAAHVRGWDIFMDADSGYYYYVNAATGESTWDPPSDVMAADPSEWTDVGAVLAAATGDAGVAEDLVGARLVGV